jgi:acyl transferase domain-containing protein/acyl-CoA synthetase (AMP-forming)/AMP-acid ligase II/acyl carrier protein
MKMQTNADVFLLNSIFETCKKNAGKKLFISKNENTSDFLTGKDLEHSVRKIGSFLQKQIPAQSKVILFLPQGLEYVSALLGCLHANVTAVPTPITDLSSPELVCEKINPIVNSAEAVMILTNDHFKKYFTLQKLFPESKCLSLDDIYKSDCDIFSPKVADKSDLAILLYTSGSVSQPKGVMLSHENLFLQATNGSHQWKMNNESVIVSWMPQFHNFGLHFNILSPLLSGATSVILLPGNFVKTPEDWFINIFIHNATHTAAPNFAFDYSCSSVDLDRLSNISLHSLQMITCGGEPIRKETCEKFMDKFQKLNIRENIFCSHYGLSETGSVTTKEPGKALRFLSLNMSALEQQKIRITTEERNSKSITSCGSISENGIVVIVNPESSNRSLSGEVGELWIKSPAVALGYLNLKEETNFTFSATISATLETGFFRTGDLGFIDDNHLFIVGRQKDVIIVNGKNHHPIDIEWTIKKHLSELVLPIAVFSVEQEQEEKVVVIQELDHPLAENDYLKIVTRILAAVSETHGLQIYEINFVELGSIPKTGSGKVQRRICKNAHIKSMQPVLYKFKQKIEDPGAGKKVLDLKREQNILEILKQQIFPFLIGAYSNELSDTSSFSELGLDSIKYVRLAGKIEKEFKIEFSPALFFKYRNLKELAAYINLSTGQLIDQPRIAPASYKKDNSAERSGDAIAVVGISFQFPGGACDMDSLWDNLVNQKDAIGAIPKERLAFNPEERNAKDAFPKYGGFIENVSTFDAEFFGITPLEAESMDPQQRKTLELTWNVIENSGYNPRDFSGQYVGIFMGVHNNDYAELITNQPELMDIYGGLLDSGLHMSMISNRVSRWFNFQGPSETINTACSSSLVAIHHAVTAIQRGECNMAIAGGINLILSPRVYQASYKAGMLARDGRCKTFDQAADGFVRAEGFGAVLLKPLTLAQQDKDIIYGVIKGVAINHDGRSNSLRAPNLNAQKQLIQTAYSNAGVSPERVNYIEAHGTGTSLGDPIEIKALQEAFNEMNQELPANYCGVGTVKTNIGHCESAAGIAGFIKVLLAMNHGILPGVLHFKKINPFIQLENSPFYIVKENEEWKRIKNAKGEELTRIAGISSFGFGGANVHVIVEEYHRETPPEEVAVKDIHHEEIIPLSAKNKERLYTLAEQFLLFTEKHVADAEVTLRQMAYTLQVGRDAMNERLVFLVNDKAELIQQLKKYIAENKSHSAKAADSAVVNKHAQNQLLGEEDFRELIVRWFEENKKDKIAQLWLQGAAIDWKIFYKDQKISRVSLPGYSFAKEHYWIPEKKLILQNGLLINNVFLHPLLHENTSDLTEQRYSSVFTGEEFFLAHHQINDMSVLPAVAYLEMLRVAIIKASNKIQDKNVVVKIKNISWSTSFIVHEIPCKINVRIFPQQNNELQFEVYSTDEFQQQDVIYSQGVAFIDISVDLEDLDISKLKTICNKEIITPEQCYNHFKENGISYGSSFRCVDEIYTGDQQLLVKLSLPLTISDTIADYILHPSLLDAALHASIALEALCTEKKIAIPFALDEITIIKACTLTMWAWIRQVKTTNVSGSYPKIDIDLCNEKGDICVKLRGLTKRVANERMFPEKSNISTSTHILLQPEWIEKSISTISTDVNYEKHLVIICEPDAVAIEEIKSQSKEIQLLVLETQGESIEKRYELYTIQIIEALQRLLSDRSVNRILVQLVILNEAEKLLFAGLSGLLKTMKLENPRTVAQILQLENFNGLVQKLISNSKSATDFTIRYSSNKRLTQRWRKIESMGAQAPWKNDGVYLITGGAGGLGILFAKEIIRNITNARVILIGRSSSEVVKKILADQLHTSTSKVEYRTVDITNKTVVEELINEIIRDFGQLNGILHGAGVIQDSFLIKKSKAEIHQVLAPKVSGLINLDLASKQVKLDFFVCFSSIASSIGSIGQADYASANGFMDEYARYRNQLVVAQKRTGHTLSINWPLWKDGGMKLSPQTEKAILEKLGMIAMDAANGFSTLYKSLSLNLEQVMTMEGDADLFQRSLLHVYTEMQNPIVNSKKEMSSFDSGFSFSKSEEKRLSHLKKIVASVTHLPEGRIDVHAPMEQYGIDSVMILELTSQLEKVFGPLSKTLFFEYQNLNALNRYLIDTYPEKEVETANKKTLTADKFLPDDSFKSVIKKRHPIRFHSSAMGSNKNESSTKLAIAVIGLSGKYAQANNIDEYWNNLKEGKNCIEEIPADRWDWKENFNPQKGKKGKVYTKWGGFITDIDKFDPLFFHLSPVDAEKMDPQERLFIEQAYASIEDAGYTPLNISENRKVGVFAGVMHGLYPSEPAFWSIANRVSYLFNFQGPSLAVDTACSSSLTAIHLAIESIRSGASDCAIAGGVNLIVDPAHYIGLSEMTMVSSSDQCRSFGANADGFVDGEGVGAIVLKPLEKAILDGDHIYGIIKGSSINAGGKTNGYTVPNPVAQGALIASVLQENETDARSISYVEAHGTGTALGDPIEISGLNRAFELHTMEKQFCAIGSAKSNIGHCESAAGIAGLTKILLQLKFKQLVPSLHSNVLNPNIDFEKTPFRVQQYLTEWKRPVIKINGDDVEFPRRAGLSSFGAGGANAHLLIEEYNSPISDVENEAQTPVIILLSARNKVRLEEQVMQLLLFIDEKQCTDTDLPSIAYTLQVGRVRMEERLAFGTSSIEELKEKLKCFLAGNESTIYCGNIKENKTTLALFLEDEELQEVMEKWIARKKYSKLSELWVKGLEIDWINLYNAHKPLRMSLPTYPFARERYWLERKIVTPRPGEFYSEPVQVNEEEMYSKIVDELLDRTIDIEEAKMKIKASN